MTHGNVCLSQEKLVLGVTTRTVPVLCPPCPTPTSLLAPDVLREACVRGRSQLHGRLKNACKHRRGTRPQERIPPGVGSEAKLCHQVRGRPSPFRPAPPAPQAGAAPSPHTPRPAAAAEHWSRGILPRMHRALEQAPFVCRAHAVAACPWERGSRHPAARKPTPFSKVVRNIHPRALPSPPPATGGATGTHRFEGRQRVGARAVTPSAPGSPPAGGATSGRRAGTRAAFPAPPARPRCPRPAEGVERPRGAVSPAGGREQPRGRQPGPPHPGSAGR